MAKVVAKIFDQYLGVLFSDFSSKNVSSQLYKGHLEVHDVHVRKELLKEALSPVFPNLEIRKAVCDKVVLKIPLAKLNSEPTLVSIGVIPPLLPSHCSERRLTPPSLGPLPLLRRSALCWRSRKRLRRPRRTSWTCSNQRMLPSLQGNL